MESNIKKEIEDLIYRDLSLLKLGIGDEDRVWEYRDNYFLNGSYDWLFIDYIKDKKLTK
jgi:hypothetical protein